MLKVLDAAAIQRQLTGVEPLSGSNYSRWKSQLEIVLGYLDYEFVLIEDEPEKATNDSSDAVKLKHQKWEKANRMSLKIIRNSIRLLLSLAIRGGIPETKTAKELMEVIKTQFVGS